MQNKIMHNLDLISNSVDSQIIDLMSKTYLYGATIGEITTSLSPSNNNIMEVQALTQNRLSEDFENLRKMSSD